MTEITAKRTGGRPPLPPAPRDATETRTLIAAEVVKTNPRVRTLQQLYRLLKSYVGAEDRARADAKTRAIEESNRLKQEELALKKQDYRLRFSQKPLGVRQLLTEAERLKARIAELEGFLAKQGLVEMNSYCSEISEKADTGVTVA
jgi:hypothetical protein